MSKTAHKQNWRPASARIKPRFLFLTATLLAVIFLVIIVVGVHENQDNMLRMLNREGKALMEAIFISAQNAIRASDLVNDLVVDDLVDVAALIEMDLKQASVDMQSLNLACQLLGINRIDIVDSTGKIISSNFAKIIGENYDSAFLRRLPLEEVINGRAGVVTFVLESEGVTSTDQLVAAVSSEARRGATVLFINHQRIDSFDRRIGIGSMIRNMGRQPGIDYIFLQSRQGVALSSRQLQPVLAIESDPFLKNLLESAPEDSRRLTFEGNGVLEICRPFSSQDLPAGILRLGLSLEGFHQVDRNYKIQLTVLGFILFVLTFLLVSIVMANQSYRSVEAAYEQFKTITSNILEGIESAVVAIDSGERIIMLNPKTEKLFNLNATQCLGKKYAEIFPEDQFLLKELFNSNQDAIMKEIAHTDREGKNLILLAAASRLVDADDVVQGGVGLAHDMTARKRLEAQAKSAERLSELGSLAAGVAHEIRNPLNAIAIAAQRLKGEFTVVQDQSGFEKLAGTIKSEIDRLNSIIAQFLALARSSRLSREEVDLKEFVEESVGLFGNEAHALGIVLGVDIGEGINISVDRQELKKVLGNLIKNALEAIGKNGQIVLRGKIDKSQVQIMVEDSGPGIDPENLERVFAPYYTTKISGTGLGLAISYRIVRDHGGILTVENIKPHGARFIINLPKAI